MLDIMVVQLFKRRHHVGPLRTFNAVSRAIVGVMHCPVNVYS